MVESTKFDKSIKEQFSASRPELVAILEEMLELNQFFRPSAKTLLKNKIFDPIRIKDNEKHADYKIKIHVDIGEEAENYKTDKDSKK